MFTPSTILHRRAKPIRRAALALAAALLLAFPGGAPAQEGSPAHGDGHEHAQEPSGGHGGHGGHTQGHGYDDPLAGQEPTAIERDAANALVAATRAGTARLADPEVAQAEGYVQGTSYAFYGLRAAHFTNLEYSHDGVLLDPARPENVMYLKHEDGTLELIGVMFTAPAGTGPRVGGPLTFWHTHPDLCSGQDGLILKFPDGSCPPETASVDFEMLHVWLIDVPGGPFADNPVGEIPGPLVGAGSEHNSIVAGSGLVDAEAMIGEVGELLGLTPEAIGRHYEAGQSLAEMAAAQGVEREALVDLMTDWLIAGFAEAVARGDMSEAERDLTVRHLTPQVERMVEIHAGEPWLKATAT